MKSRFLAIIPLLIILVRIWKPTINIDSITIYLLVISFSIWFLPEIKRVKFKDIEFETKEKQVQEKVASLESDINKKELLSLSETKVNKLSTSNKYPALHSDYVKEYRNIISSNASNSQKILSASLLLERMIIETAQDFDLIKENEKSNPSKLINTLIKEEILSEVDRKLFNDFMSIRNLAIHYSNKEISNSQTANILNLLNRFITVFG